MENYAWVLGVQCDNREMCRLLLYLAIACILEYSPPHGTPFLQGLCLQSTTNQGLSWFSSQNSFFSFELFAV